MRTKTLEEYTNDLAVCAIMFGRAHDAARSYRNLGIDDIDAACVAIHKGVKEEEDARMECLVDASDSHFMASFTLEQYAKMIEDSAASEKRFIEMMAEEEADKTEGQGE